MQKRKEQEERWEKRRQERLRAKELTTDSDPDKIAKELKTMGVLKKSGRGLLDNK